MNIKHNKNLEFCNVSETIVAGVFIDTSQKNNSELSYHFFCKVIFWTNCAFPLMAINSL